MPSEDEFQEIEDYEVEKIMNDRVLKNGQVSIQAIIMTIICHINIILIFQVQFRIRWTNHQRPAETWENVENLNCHMRIADYYFKKLAILIKEQDRINKEIDSITNSHIEGMQIVSTTPLQSFFSFYRRKTILYVLVSTSKNASAVEQGYSEPTERRGGK